MALFTPSQLDELRQLAAGMLGHIREVLDDGNPDPARFGQMLRRVQTGYGMRGAAHVVRAWLDAVIDASPTVGRGEITAVVYANPDGTAYTTGTHMTPDYQWAGDVLVARLADDQVALYRLIDQIPAGRAGLYLLRTVQLCAELLRAYDNPDPADRPVRVGEVITVPARVLTGRPVRQPSGR